MVTGSRSMVGHSFEASISATLSAAADCLADRASDRLLPPMRGHPAPQGGSQPVGDVPLPGRGTGGFMISIDTRRIDRTPGRWQLRAHSSGSRPGANRSAYMPWHPVVSGA